MSEMCKSNIRSVTTFQDLPALSARRVALPRRGVDTQMMRAGCERITISPVGLAAFVCSVCCEVEIISSPVNKSAAIFMVLNLMTKIAKIPKYSGSNNTFACKQVFHKIGDEFISPAHFRLLINGTALTLYSSGAGVSQVGNFLSGKSLYQQQGNFAF